MDVLRIRLFGTVWVARDGIGVELKVTRSAQALLAYLLLHRDRLHSRETLAALFWADQPEERARSCLSTALWRLRRVLESDGISRGTYLVTRPTGEVGFNGSSGWWLDVASFEAAAKPTVSRPFHDLERKEVGLLEEAVGFYTGDLLEGFYDDWALRERERLRSLYLGALACLMHYHGYQGGYDAALACGQRILDHDPLREEIHRDMMRLYLENGQRPLALRQYRICREALGKQLQVDPMEETRSLYAQIAGNARSGGAPATRTGEARTFNQALELLKGAIDSFDQASQQLHRAVQVVERFSTRG
jgi:DNA-binding SARP family transcriptional activator